MDRRTFLAGTGTVLLAAPLAAEQRGRVATVGELVNNPLLQETLRRGLREVGYVERRNIVFESRSPSSRLPDLAAELVRFPVDVIVVDTTPALQAVREVTRTMPIVMVGFGDPVAEGFVASLARPGGNITGLSWLTPEVAGKRLELLHEVLPKLTRVAVLLDPNDTVAVVERSAIETAAHATGVTIETFEARDPATLTAVFAAIKKARAEALISLDREVECDVIVCGDDKDAKQSLRPLVAAIPGCRYVDGGPLANSRTVEAITALLIGFNIRYKTHTGLRITGID